MGNASTGLVGAALADVPTQDGAAAIAAAAEVQSRWAQTSPDERSAVLSRAHALLIERTEELALLTTLEMGKSLRESRAEIRYSADFSGGSPAALCGSTSRTRPPAVVVKPAEQTPLSMPTLTRLLIEAGLPAGVLNVVPTTSPAAVTDAIIGDGRLRKVSFTGLTESVGCSWGRLPSTSCGCPWSSAATRRS